MFKKIGFKTKVILEAALSVILIASFVFWYKPVTVEANNKFLSVSVEKSLESIKQPQVIPQKQINYPSVYTITQNGTSYIGTKTIPALIDLTGNPQGQVVLTHVFEPNGLVTVTNNAGDQLTIQIPSVKSVVTTNTTITYLMQANIQGATVTANVTFDFAVKPDRVKISIDGTATKPTQLSFPLNGNRLHRYDSALKRFIEDSIDTHTQTPISGVAFDWSDAIGITWAFSNNQLVFNIGTSFSIDPSTISTSTVSYAMADPFERSTFYLAGRHWVWYYNGTNTGFDSTADSGGSWKGFTSYNSRILAYSSLYWDATNSKICIAQTNGGTANIYYRQGTPNSDGTITWDSAEVQINTNVAFEISLTKDSSGYPVVSYAKLAIDHYHPTVAIASATDGSTWNASVEVGASDAGTTSTNQIVPRSSRQLTVVNAITGSTLRSTTYNGSTWAGSWTTASSGLIYYNAAFSAVADGDNVAVAFNEETSGDINFQYHNGTNWLATDETAHTGVLGYSHPAITKISSGKYRVFFGHTSTSIAYIDRTSGTWDADATNVATGEATLSGHVGMCSPESPISNLLTLGWVTGTSNPYSVRFDYQTVANASISNSPTSKAFGVVNPNSTYWSNGSAPAFGAGGSFSSTNSSSSNSGTWTNPTNAYADGGAYASILSGTPSANQTYGNYGFALPANATITSLRVRTDASSSGSSTNNTASPTASMPGWWTNASNAYDSAESYASITSGVPSSNQTYGNYGFNLTTESITSVKVKPNALTVGTPGTVSTITVYPSSDNTTTGYVAVPTSPSTIYDKVNESGAADHTKYATGQTQGGATLLLNFTSPGIAADATVQWVNLSIMSKDNATGTNAIAPCIRVGGTNYSGNSSDPGAGWATYSTNWTSNPKTGALWTPGDVNGTSGATSALQCIGSSSSDFNPDADVDTIRVTIGYTTASVYDELLRCQVSWDGGTSWSTSQNATLTSSNATYTFDVTSAVSWNGTYLNDTNFKVRIDAYTVGTASEVRVSWIPVEVIYTGLNNEQIRVAVSWDGGTSWSSKYVHGLTGVEQTFYDNVTSVTSWTVNTVNDTNFKVNVDAYTQGEPGEVRLDWIPVEIYYTTPSGITSGECYFTLTNDGGVSANVSVKTFNFTSSGTSWNVTDSSPGLDTVRMNIYRSGDSSSDNTTLGLTDKVFKNNIAAGATVPWELKFETGTFSDGASNNTTIRYTAIQS